jgi:hypothetical protein
MHLMNTTEGKTFAFARWIMLRFPSVSDSGSAAEAAEAAARQAQARNPDMNFIMASLPGFEPGIEHGVQAPVKRAEAYGRRRL